MYLAANKDYLEEVERRLRRQGRGPLEPNEVEELLAFILYRSMHSPFDSSDVDDGMQSVIDRRPEEAPNSTRSGRSADRARSLAVRALEECASLVGGRAVKTQVEKWRVDVFREPAAPLSAEGPLRFSAVADWMEAEARRTEQKRHDRQAENLYYPGRGVPASVRVWSYPGESPLGSLTNVVHIIQAAMSCEDDAAVAHALTGEVPYVPPVSVAIGRRSLSMPHALRPISVQVNYPWVPADEVRRVYLLARDRLGRDLRAGDRSARTARVRMLVGFVEERSGNSWAELSEEWQLTHPDWGYKTPRSMRNVYARATSGGQNG
jgi:hypothetical protein